MDYGDQEYPNVHTLSIRHIKAARKEHICGYCKKSIKIGQRYFLYSFIEEGEFKTIKTHSIDGSCAGIGGQ